MKISGHFTKLTSPSIGKLLIGRAMCFHIFLHIYARYHIHDRIDIAALAFNHVINTRQILMFERFQNVCLGAFIHPSLELLLHTLDNNIHVQTIFVRTVKCAHSAFAQRIDSAVSAPQISCPLAGIVIIHTHTSV